MINKFLQVEEKYNLLTDSINEFKYWGYIRFDLYKMLGNEKFSRKTVAHENSVNSKRYTSLFRNLILKNPNLHLNNLGIP